MSSMDQKKMPMNLRLPMYMDLFIKDFSFSDIKSDLLKADQIFTDTEIKRISDIHIPEHQVIQMFFFLYEKSENAVWLFVDVLENYYNWLTIGISSNQVFEDKSRYIDVYERIGKIEPRHADLNIHRLNYFIELRKHLKTIQPHHYVVLFGDLGCGKKWLAMDVCKDYGVLEAMDFEVHWIDMKGCSSKEDDLNKLHQFATSIYVNTNQSTHGIIRDIQNKIRANYADPKCLLVLTEVHHKNIIKLFDFNCKVLITTRNKNVRDYFSKNSATILTMEDSFSDDEGTEFLQKIRRDQQIEFDTAEAILENTKNHPYLLNSLAKTIEGKPTQVWRQTIIDTKSNTNTSILDKIYNSLKVFNMEEKHIFDHFVVFQHSVPIPANVLSKFCRIDNNKMEKILEKFDKFSVLRLGYLKGSVRVCYQKYIYFQYLQNNSTLMDNISEAHKQLVDIYDLETQLNTPNDSTSFVKNDEYFYYFIGYHLKKAGMEELLQRLYLDFRFLGQNIKANGLQKTFGDMKHYKKEIIGSNKEKEKLYNALLIFLPTIEEFFDDQSDSNLLHYALNSSDDTISQEAKQQALKIPNSIFFKSKGFNYKRQIYKSQGVPTYIKMLNADKCLISLEDARSYIADLYLGYVKKPTFLVKRSFVHIKIERSELISNDVLLTLDIEGTLSTWDISNEKKPAIKRTSSTKLVNSLNAMSSIKNKTSIQDLNDNFSDKVKSFHINKDGRLLIGDSKGEITMMKWNERTKRFRKLEVQKIKTKIINMKYIHDLGDHHCIVVDHDGKIFLVYFTDSFIDHCKIKLREDRGRLINLHYKCFNAQSHTFYLVFEKCCYSLEFVYSDSDSYKYGYEIIYKTDETIRCSHIWIEEQKEKYYLIFGIGKNIIIYDIDGKNIIHPCPTGRPIVCFDIFPIDDENFQLAITTGLRDRTFLQIYAITIDFKWSYEQSEYEHFPRNIYLKSGNQDFSASYSSYHNDCEMFAIDSENKIHNFNKDEKNYKRIPVQVTSIASGLRTFYGCVNGDIYNFKTDTKLQLNQIVSPISYMKVIGNILVASADSGYTILYEIHENITYIINTGGKLLDSWFLNNNVVVLFNTNEICLWNINQPHDLHRKLLDIPYNIYHADVNSKTLICITDSCPPRVHIYTIFEDELRFELRVKYDLQTESSITKLALSHNAEVFAVGFESGKIEIYETSRRIPLLYELVSHKSPITDLKFCPWDNSYERVPIVLASCSEELCFWDISYTIRNKFKPKNLNISSRFCSPAKSDRNTEIFKYPVNPDNVWNEKVGIRDKKELLSCIKFNNKVEKLCCNESFTRFNTIDNSGCYYDFQVQTMVYSNS